MLNFFFKNLIWHLRNSKYFINLIFYYFFKILTIILKVFDKRFNRSDFWCKKHLTNQKLIKKIFLNNKPMKKIQFKEIKKTTAANINLIYSIIKNNHNIKKIIETGVAYGYSSHAILKAIQKKNGAILWSVDMPYVEKSDITYVGSAVPKYLLPKWRLLRCPDLFGLRKIAKTRTQFDLAHYDSDKTYFGRMISYERIYNMLKKGGIFISDDIGDNFAFKHFVKKKKTKFYLVKYKTKYQGLFIK